jgi:hypothetical protein
MERMMLGPISSPYPGKYFCFGVAAFCATILWRSLRFEVRAFKEQQKAHAQAISFKPDVKKSVSANIWVAIVAAFLLATSLAAICRMWPH